jgi:2'-5' RNA ligase
MMVHYLIEFRFTGYGKRYLKSLIFDVASKFRVKGVTRKRPVPHISLYGPFTTIDEKRMVDSVVDVVKDYKFVSFKIKGFDYFEGKRNWFIGPTKGKVIYLDIEPSEELKELHWMISKKLQPFCRGRPYDNEKDFKFHATIAFKDIDRKFNQIWDYLKSKEEPNINQYLLRVTLIKGQRILYEYDLLQHRLLDRKQALSKHYWKKTFKLLKQTRT